MKSIPQYTFHKTKYGDELLIDVVELGFIKKYLEENSVHTLTYYDITLITQGEGFFRINDKTYQVKPNDIIFTSPGAIRHWDKEHLTEAYALIFEEEFLLSFFNDPGFIRNLSYFHPENNHFLLQLSDISGKRILELIRLIQNEINTYPAKDEHLLRAFLYETLMLLNREFTHNSGNQKLTVKTGKSYYINRFTELVSESFTNEHSTQYYADKLCITPNYLNEIIKAALGVNTKQYIQNKIIAEAKKKLIYTNLPVTEIAEQLGYKTASYFIRSFQKSTGYTPLEYRQNTKP